VIANFVSTLDGVVSYGIPGESGGGEISGFDQADRFLMGLLRASADAVMIGSGTLHETSPKHVWTAEAVNREAKALYDDFRQNVLRKPALPLNVVVSGSGAVDLERGIFHKPGLQTVVITTEAGALRLAGASVRTPSSPRVCAIGQDCTANIRISADAILHLLYREFGVRLLLTEGGPTLLGSLLEKKLMDELFLTIAPQIAGRSALDQRIGVVQGAEFRPETAPWMYLLSAKSAGSHLYLRYQMTSQVKT
jgi:riboflavin biosynthesis pyrimidine reductase